MDISPYVQDENGMTALMHAVYSKDLLFVVEKFCSDFRCCNIEDKNGENVLFHSIHNYFALVKLTELDINHLNHNHETVLLHCCKNEIYEPVKTLLDRPGIDLTIVDNENKTALMYLAEKERDNEIMYCAISKGYAFNYVNEQGESVLSILLKKLYRKDYYVKERESVVRIAHIITSLVKGDVDFNVVVDEDGNTALMVPLIAHDFETFGFLVRFGKNLDFSKKNINGENATSLFLKTAEADIFEKMIVEKYNLFDYKYIDPFNKNTALMLATMNHSNMMEDIIRYYYQSINSVNNYQENALIISAKMNHIKAANILLSKGIQVNQQDVTGNTALHYAVKSKNIEMIQKLIEYDADCNILNNDKESSMELARCSEDKNILMAVCGTLSPSDLKETIYIKPNKTPQLIEYSYYHVSNIYIEIDKNGIDDLKQKAIREVYGKYVPPAPNKLLFNYYYM